MTINWYTDLTLEEARLRYPHAIIGEVALRGDKEISIAPLSMGAPSALPVVTRRKVSIDVEPNDSSYRYRALMDLPQLVLKFSLAEYVEIPVGAWCYHQEQKFTLREPQNIKKQGNRNIEYTITMGTEQDNATIYKMINSVDGRLKYSMCAKPHEFIEEIVKNLNLRDSNEATTEGKWLVGACIEADEKTVEFNHTYILEALTSVAQTFETEWEIIENVENETFTIALHKAEYYKSNPLDLAYGRGNGFVPGVGRTTQSDEAPIKRLYTEGTERNIDRSKNYPSLYGATAQESDTTSPELRLPSARKIYFDGTHYAYDNNGTIVDKEDGFVAASARCYVTNRDGSYIERSYRAGEKRLQAVKEDSLDCSEIYPSYYSTPTSVNEQVDGNLNFYDIIDDTISESLNFTDYLIAGETMTIVFQSGMLAGKEFDVKYKHAERKFEIVPQEIDGVMMPNATFKPTTADRYAIFGIMLPQDYICNNATHKGAAWDMYRQAVKHLYEHEEQKYTFTGELQGLWAKQNWLRVGGHLKVGAYINFTDPQFAPDGELIRIVGVKDNVNSPYSPTLEISNSVGAGRSVSSALSKIDNTEVVIEDTKKDVISYTKRRFRDAVETLDAFAELFGDKYSPAINPVTVQTMSALIGDESLQFRFILIDEDDEDNTYQEVSLPWNYVRSTGLHISRSILQHLTLNQSLTAEHDFGKGDYAIWRMSPYNSGYIDPDDFGVLFLYAVCNKSSQNGSFRLSESKLPFDDGAHYNMLVGILSSEYDGERSFVTVYGYTEILPGRITTDLIASTDGTSFLNLVNGAMQLGEWLQYNVDGDRALHLKFLLAENAELAGWIFHNNKLWSQSGGCFLDGVTGAIASKGILLKKVTHITADNIGDYSDYRDQSGMHPYYELDIYRAGAVVVIDSLPNVDGIMLGLPFYGVWACSSFTEEQKNEVRSYLGTEVYLYNNTDEGFIFGWDVMDEDTSVMLASDVISPHSFYVFRCRLGTDTELLHSSTPSEHIYWSYKKGTLQ